MKDLHFGMLGIFTKEVTCGWSLEGRGSRGHGGRAVEVNVQRLQEERKVGTRVEIGFLGPCMI